MRALVSSFRQRSRSAQMACSTIVDALAQLKLCALALPAAAAMHAAVSQASRVIPFVRPAARLHAPV